MAGKPPKAAARMLRFGRLLMTQSGHCEHLGRCNDLCTDSLQFWQATDVFSYGNFVILPVIGRPIGRPPFRKSLVARAAPKRR